PSTSAQADDPVIIHIGVFHRNDARYGMPAFADMTFVSIGLQRITSIANLPDRRRVLDAALGPEPIDAAADAELRPRSHIALEDFAIVADLLDDAHHPVLGQTELLAEIALDAQQAPDLGLIRFERFVDGLGGYAQLLGIEHRIERPFDHIEPLIVA